MLYKYIEKNWHKRHKVNNVFRLELMLINQFYFTSSKLPEIDCYCVRCFGLLTF